MASGWKEVAPRQSPYNRHLYATTFIAVCAGAACARGLKGLKINRLAAVAASDALKGKRQRQNRPSFSCFSDHRSRLGLCVQHAEAHENCKGKFIGWISALPKRLAH